jgi:hypothetical protein
MIDRKGWMAQAEGKCSYTAMRAKGNTHKFSFTCTDPEGSGEGALTLLSKTSYTSAITVNTLRNGKPESVTFEGSSKFLDADCGSVSPLPMAQK